MKHPIVTALILTIFSQSSLALKEKKKDFFYFRKEIRVQLLNDLQKSLQTNYSLWNLKKERLDDFDPSTLFQEMIQKEQKIIDPPDKTQRAKLNIRYFDRLSELLASFQDTHLKFQSVVPRPSIFNGIRIMEVDNKFYLVAYNNQIIQYNQKTNKKYAYKKLTLGDEVTAINGKPVEDRIQMMLPFISSSSPLARRKNAVMALNYRNFFYPTRNYNIFTLKSKTDNSTYKLKLPFYYRKNMRLDTKLYFETIQLKSLDDLSTQWVPSKKSWEKVPLSEWMGWSFKEPLEKYWGESYYSFKKNKPKDLIYRLGITVEGGRAYGILQLYSFKPQKVMGPNQVKKKYFAPIIDFLKTLEESQTPLILDLRNNTGGKGIYPSILLGHLSEKGASYNPTTWMYRITPAVEQMIETRELKKVAPKETKEIYWMVKSLHKARKLGKPYMPPFQRTSEITASKEVGGFHQKIVALTSPKCVSACDIMASLLSHSKRATLIGLPTNGTGAGARTLHPFNGTVWKDDHKILAIKIPNFLFGYPYKIKDSPKVLSMISQYNLENRPTKPDTLYEPTLLDYLEKSKGWLQVAQRSLRP